MLHSCGERMEDTKDFSPIILLGGMYLFYFFTKTFD